MPRYRRPPLTLDEVQTDGPPVRLRDLCQITGRSRAALITEIDCGDLLAFRYRPRAGSPWYVSRDEARRWLAALGLRR